MEQHSTGWIITEMMMMRMMSQTFGVLKQFLSMTKAFSPKSNGILYLSHSTWRTKAS